jgi:drug/metabolite transporter (DMT)-like permease
MASLLALIAAVCYGAADFVGGVATRRAAAVAVVALGQATGLLLLLASLPLLPAASPTPHDVLWGALAGVAGGAGVGLLYRALAVGTMGVIAPATAVCAVAVPVLVSALLGQWPSWLSSIGIAVALASIVLVGQEPAPESGAPRKGGWPPGLLPALLSGVAIGGFYLALARTAPEAGLWPLVASRAASVTAFGVATFARRGPTGLHGGQLVLLVVGAGALDMLANVLYLLATREGSLPVVVTLTSLYPAATVVLAGVVLGERLSPLQRVGVCTALVAVVLIVWGEPR